MHFCFPKTPYVTLFYLILSTTFYLSKKIDSSRVCIKDETLWNYLVQPGGQHILELESVHPYAFMSRLRVCTEKKHIELKTFLWYSYFPLISL